MRIINIEITISNQITYGEQIDLDLATRQQADDFLDPIIKSSIESAKIIIKHLRIFKDVADDQNENTGNNPNLIRKIRHEISFFIDEFWGVDARFKRMKRDLVKYFQNITAINTRLISKLRRLNITVTRDQSQRIKNLSKHGGANFGSDVDRNAITDAASLDAAISRAELGGFSPI